VKHKVTKGTETHEVENEMSREIITAALRVHSALGPGLLESAYETCLAIELAARGVPCRRQVVLPITYGGVRVEDSYRIDLLVADQVIVELKTVDRIEPVHKSQLLTYLRLSGHWLGLLINFHSHLLKHGLHRVVNG
jgi:GxxExxY protein